MASREFYRRERVADRPTRTSGRSTDMRAARSTLRSPGLGRIPHAPMYRLRLVFENPRKSTTGELRQRQEAPIAGRRECRGHRRRQEPHALLESPPGHPSQTDARFDRIGLRHDQCGSCQLRAERPVGNWHSPSTSRTSGSGSSPWPAHTSASYEDCATTTARYGRSFSRHLTCGTVSRSPARSDRENSAGQLEGCEWISTTDAFSACARLMMRTRASSASSR